MVVVGDTIVTWWWAVRPGGTVLRMVMHWRASTGRTVGQQQRRREEVPRRARQLVMFGGGAGRLCRQRPRCAAGEWNALAISVPARNVIDSRIRVAHVLPDMTVRERVLLVELVLLDGHPHQLFIGPSGVLTLGGGEVLREVRKRQLDFSPATGHGGRRPQRQRLRRLELLERTRPELILSPILSTASGADDGTRHIELFANLPFRPATHCAVFENYHVNFLGTDRHNTPCSSVGSRPQCVWLIALFPDDNRR